MIPESGAALDSEVAERLGEPWSPDARYSTDLGLADHLVSRLAERAVFASFEQVDGVWYCTLAADVASIRQRIASGSAETRPLAICRAIVHLPVGQYLACAQPISPAVGKGFCQECGAALEKGVRSQARFCPVCAYRRGKAAHAAFELTRHSGRRRRAARPQSN
jgi:hypothetical protein